MSKNLARSLSRIVAAIGTRASTDEQLLESWLASLLSEHSRRNFEVTARRFLAELPAGGLRGATIEDVRDALGRGRHDRRAIRAQGEVAAELRPSARVCALQRWRRHPRPIRRAQPRRDAG